MNLNKAAVVTRTEPLTQVELGYTVEGIASMVAKLAVQLEYMSEVLIEDKDLPPDDEKYTETSINYKTLWVCHIMSNYAYVLIDQLSIDFRQAYHNVFR